MSYQSSYQSAGYTHLQQLVPTEIARAFLHRLKQDLAEQQVPIERFAKTSTLLKKPAIEIYGYAYKPMIHFLWGLTPTMRELTGLELLPTYNFFRIYQGGDVCRVHSDRPACEHSLSLTLAYSDDRVWDFNVGSVPLEAPKPFADDFGGETHATVQMRPGDAVLYQGVTRRHGRTQPNPNRWSAHMFLHWVDKNGPFRQAAFDGKAEVPDRVEFF